MTRLAAAVAKTPCGVISAHSEWRSEDENLASHGELLDVLLQNGYSPIEARGEWEGMPELCWVVPGIPEAELVELARDFQQNFVAYAEDGETKIIRS